VTLPVEFDASRRARLALRSSGVVATTGEEAGVNRVLNAAALTYVAAFITSLAYFLWHLLPLLTGRREE
jgi:Zn-dependent membrane protease YugP